MGTAGICHVSALAGHRGAVGTTTDEIVIHHGATILRRLRLAPAEAKPWHRDPLNGIAGSRETCTEDASQYCRSMARHEHRPASESSSAHGVECIGSLLSDDRLAVCGCRR